MKFEYKDFLKQIECYKHKFISKETARKIISIEKNRYSTLLFFNETKDCIDFRKFLDFSVRTYRNSRSIIFLSKNNLRYARGFAPQSVYISPDIFPLNEEQMSNLFINIYRTNNIYILDDKSRGVMEIE